MRAPNNLNALRAFEAVARHLSYTAAAAELNVTPAAIGQLIRGLEGYLNIELFHRSSSGPSRLSLTDAARVALPDLQGGFDLLSSAVERLKASKSRIIFTVTVARIRGKVAAVACRALSATAFVLRSAHRDKWSPCRFHVRANRYRHSIRCGRMAGPHVHFFAARRILFGMQPDARTGSECAERAVRSEEALLDS